MIVVSFFFFFFSCGDAYPNVWRYSSAAVFEKIILTRTRRSSRDGQSNSRQSLQRDSDSSYENDDSDNIGEKRKSAQRKVISYIFSI